MLDLGLLGCQAERPQGFGRKVQWESRVEAPFEEASISVVSLHGLIALKQLRGSSQDLVDIEALRFLDDQEPGAGEERSHA